MTYIAPMIPQNSPFTPAQQAWLNGLLAGLVGPDGITPGFPAADVAAVPAADLAAGAPSVAAAPVAPEPEDFPWHDPALAIDERMRLADGKPLERRMMAAMGQLDCGQCGYLCQSYAEAIARGEEKSLGKCVPGGKETSRMLKELMATPQASVAAPASVAKAAPVAPPAPDRPLTARFDGASPLNRAGSDKDTRHVVFRSEDSALAYRVGDTLGVNVANDPEIVDAIVARLGASPTLDVECPDGRHRPLRQALLETCDIGRPSDLSIEVLASRARDPSEGDRLQALAEGYPGAEPTDADLLDLLMAFPSAKPPVQELVLALTKLEPRLYSISSSPKANPGEVHLTVAAVRYQVRGRKRKGVASTYLAERVQPGAALPVYIKPAHGFALPEKLDVPIIMIGPGTGIAPFRAFLQERRAVGATRTQLAVLRRPAPRLRFPLRGGARGISQGRVSGSRRRVLPRPGGEDLRPASDARARRGDFCLAPGRSPPLRVRRRATHGAGCRRGACSHHRQAWRHGDFGRQGLSGRADAGQPLPARRLLRVSRAVVLPAASSCLPAITGHETRHDLAPMLPWCLLGRLPAQGDDDREDRPQ